MGLKRKQVLQGQKARLEQMLKDRLVFLAGKGIDPRKAEKDTIVRKLQADVRAASNRLRIVAGHEKRTEELTRIKAEKAAAPKKEEEAPKAKKAAKAPEEGKAKKPKAEKGEKAAKADKAEKKAAAPKPAEGGEAKSKPAEGAKTPTES